MTSGAGSKQMKTIVWNQRQNTIIVAVIIITGACSKLWQIIVIYYNSLEQAPAIIIFKQNYTL